MRTQLRHIKGIIKARLKSNNGTASENPAVGREFSFDLHILVDPTLSISAAHDVSEHLETEIQKQLTRPVNIIIHVEPDIPRLRK